MRTTYILLLFVILIQSCEEKSNNIIEETQVNDSIYYYDFIPDIEITSTLRYEPDTYHFCNETPIPSDSIARFNIDLNKDSVSDFEVNVKRWTYVGTGSSYQLEPCLRYQNFKSSIFATNDLNKICQNINYKPNEFIDGEIISIDSIWSDRISTLYIDSQEYQYLYIPTKQDFYLGVKIYKNNRYYYGWILISVTQDKIIINNMAINLSENVKIIAGQKK